MSDLSQPHDRFLKAMLSHPERAGALLRERLPPAIAASLSPEAPELVDGSFVDAELRAHLTDRLFRAKTVGGGIALIYVLVDHKSTPDRKTGWQLLRYQVRALEQWVRENPGWKRLPAIVPLIFYHGTKEWRLPDLFSALVEAEAQWRPHLLDFRFTVFDLGRIEDRALTRQPRLWAWLLAAKYATLENRQREARELLMEALLKAPEDLYTILRYMVEVYQSLDRQTLVEIIHHVHPEEDQAMLSLFAQEVLSGKHPEWVDLVHQKARLEGLREGQQEGRQEGRQEGEARLLLRQCRRRFGPLPEWVETRVRTADNQSLEAWGERILDACSLEELFSEQDVNNP